MGKQMEFMGRQFEENIAGIARMLVLAMIVVSFAGCGGKKEVPYERESESIIDLQCYPETEMADEQLKDAHLKDEQLEGEQLMDEQLMDEQLMDEQLQYADEESNAMLGLKQYINDNLQLMGMFYTPPFEFDATGDGHPDLCTNLTRGSGIISTEIVVYDSFQQKGYVLSERGDFDFFIQGVENGEIKILKRQNYPRSLGDELDEFQGVLVFEDDALGFVEKE